jgi:hypothetical protein
MEMFMTRRSVEMASNSNQLQERHERRGESWPAIFLSKKQFATSSCQSVTARIFSDR